jgi:hypothetical protein
LKALLVLLTAEALYVTISDAISKAILRRKWCAPNSQRHYAVHAELDIRHAEDLLGADLSLTSTLTHSLARSLAHSLTHYRTHSRTRSLDLSIVPSGVHKSPHLCAAVARPAWEESQASREHLAASMLVSAHQVRTQCRWYPPRRRPPQPLLFVTIHPSVNPPTRPSIHPSPFIHHPFIVCPQFWTLYSGMLLAGQRSA